MALLCWIAAALMVIQVERTISPISAGGSVAVKTCAIVAIAFAYMRLIARTASLDHALFVGVTWLVLAIVVEIVEGRHAGRGWFELLGPPDSPLRNVLMFAWIGAPALFARYRE